MTMTVITVIGGIHLTGVRVAWRGESSAGRHGLPKVDG